MTANEMPSQVERIRALLIDRGAFGLNETEFAAPNVVDGGKPIQRVAARIYELRREGLAITTTRESNMTATYRLVDVVAVDDDGQTRLWTPAERAA